MNTRELHLDTLIGREVRGRNNHPVGRLEDIRSEMQGHALVVTDFVIGVAGLFERLGLGVTILFGHRAQGYVARWNQIDLSDADNPRLTCAIEDLRRE